MSGQPAGRVAAVAAWVRYGAIAGFFAFACTLGVNLAFIWLKPGLVGVETRSEHRGDGNN